ncbi:MAG: YbgA family protein [Thermodesulfobacteriota bacterium]
MHPQIKIGISACLLGEKVRYDGGHKWDRFLTDTLGRYVDLAPVCPEVECGLGVPREAMRLTGDPAAPRLLTIRTHQDLTERMLNWARRRVEELAQENLSGFIFKSRSPSSGMARVKVYNDRGVPSNRGTGLFAATFMARLPWLPVEDEGRLHDPLIRENFVERIFTFRRWQELSAQKWTIADIIAFHSRHKLLIMAHSPKHYQLLGRLTARAKEIPGPELAAQYQEYLLTALKLQATNKKQANVLQHILGYFKKILSPDEKQELLALIDSYRRGDLPLLGPLTLINHYVRKYGPPYLAEQYYLHPHPLELQLRYHA